MHSGRDTQGNRGVAGRREGVWQHAATLSAVHNRTLPVLTWMSPKR